MSELSSAREGGPPGGAGAGAAASAGAGGAATAGGPASAPSAPSAFTYIGRPISLISRSQIRYEGVLYTIDTNKSEVALQNVVMHGTEGRHRPQGPVPPSGHVAEFLIFKGADILDLQVLPPPPPPQAQQLPYHDPAIVASSYSQHKPLQPAPTPATTTHDVQFGNFAPSPVQATPMAPPTHHPHQQHMQRYAQSQQQQRALQAPISQQQQSQTALNPRSLAQSQPQSQSRPPAHSQPLAQTSQPSETHTPAGRHAVPLQDGPETQATTPTPVSAASRPVPQPVTSAPTVDASATRSNVPPTSSAASTSTGVQPGGLRPLPPGVAAPAASSAMSGKVRQASAPASKWGPPPHARTWGNGGRSGGNGPGNRAWGGGGNRPPAPGATGGNVGPGNGSGPGERRTRGRRTRRRGPGLEVPSEDYDFESMQNKFEKASLDEAPAGMPAIAEPYDRNKGFFDQLVPEKQMPRDRTNAAQRRATDMETFGEVGNAHRHTRYRGRGRRGRSRHRGPHQSHHQHQQQQQQN